MLTPYTTIETKEDVIPLLDDNTFVLSLCENLLFLMNRSISPNGNDYVCCPRKYAPVLGLYVKIYKFWKECLNVYKRGEIGIYIAYGRILYEAYIKMLYLICNGIEALNEFRLVSYKNRISAYKKTNNSSEGTDFVRNNKFLEDLQADGFTLNDIELAHPRTFKSIQEIVESTYTKDEKDILYTLIYGLSSDAIHSDWGELRQIHLNDTGDGMMMPNIEEITYDHYRIILPIADIVSQAIQVFIPFINDTKEIIIAGDSFIAMAEETHRVIRLAFEHIADDYENNPDEFLLK
jgi:hypothetical protein